MSASEDASVVHSGFCFKKGVYFMQWKRRFCVLRSDGEVRYYLEDSATRPGHGDGHPIGIIDMKTATSVAAMPLDESSAHTRIGFFVACPDRTWEMAAANEAERDLWISAMRAAIREQYNPCMVRHQGMVEKRGHLIRNWKHRWFVITNQAMFYFTTELLAERFVRLAPFEFKKIIDNILELAQGAVLLTGATCRMIGDFEDKSCCFLVTTTTGVEYHISASSNGEADVWMAAINAAAAYEPAPPREDAGYAAGAGVAAGASTPGAGAAAADSAQQRADERAQLESKLSDGSSSGSDAGVLKVPVGFGEASAAAGSDAPSFERPQSMRMSFSAAAAALVPAPALASAPAPTEEERMQLVYRQRTAWDAFIKQASGAGFRVLKHGRWGSPHERQLRCALDTQQLTWGSKSDSMLALTAITAVVAGKTTKVFAGVGDDDAPPSECLSFICTNRTLDLQLANEAERDHVVAMFQRLLKKLAK